MNVVDLFCGCGGFTQGFKSEFDILAGVDKNQDALQTYRDNHSADAFNIDLSEVDPSELYDKIGIEDQTVHGIIGGPPCQGFSQAGNQDSDDPRNKLVKNYFSIIEENKPKFFLMENVPAITYERNSHVIEFIKNRCDEFGYNLKYKTLNAANFGVPQTRKRTFFMGFRDEDPLFPQPNTLDWIGMNDVIEVPDGQIVSSYGTSETLRGERNTRHTSEPSYTLRATRCLIDIIPNDYEPPENGDIPSISDARIYRLDEDEAAVIQSFPKSYDFCGNKTSKQEQIGNSVPPKLAQSLADKVSDILNH